jgi:glycosyltransferase involved in cell wall biosynthesis
VSTTDRPAVVYDPYLCSLGGAERYAWETAALLQARGHETILAGPVLPASSDVKRYGFDPQVRLVALSPTGYLRATRGAAVSVWVGNAVPRPSLAHRRLAVLSFPFQDLRQGAGGWLRRVLVGGVHEVVVYSEFSRAWTEARWGVDATVVPPAVVLRQHDRSGKEPLVLAVGRFFPSAHSKRQDVLIEAFERLIQRPEASGYRLALAGGLERDRPDHVAWYDGLVESAAGLPVDFYPSVDNTDLDRLFAKASVFWHAAGFGRPAQQPERAEHFGITTVEAMSAGAAPLVFADGGQLEIVTPDVGGLWHTADELVEQTAALLRRGLVDAASLAVERSRLWDQAAFRERFSRLLAG